MNLVRSPVLCLLLLLLGCGGCSSRSRSTRQDTAKPTANVAPKPTTSALATAVLVPDKPHAVFSDEEDPRSIVSKGALGHRARRIDVDKIAIFDKTGMPVLSLGKNKGATFDPTGKLIYAWNESMGTLYDVVTAKKLADVPKGTHSDEGAGFSANGQRIIEVCEGIRFLSVPDLKITFAVKGGHSELHQTARRALTIRNVEGPKSHVGYDLRLMLIDIDAEKIVGSIPMNEAMMHVPNFAFGADGKKMSMSYAGTSVWDTTTNKIILLEEGEIPAHPRYEPGAAYFAPDGNSLCVAQQGSIRAISIFNVPKGKKRHCFIVDRRVGQWASEISTGDYAAKIIDIPFARGTEHPRGLHGLYYRVKTEAMSPDGDIVAVIEQSPGATKDGPLDMWLLIADAKTGDVKHRVILPQIPNDVHRFEVAFAGHGKWVTVWNGDTKKVVAFEVETGAAVPVPPDFVQPDE